MEPEDHFDGRCEEEYEMQIECPYCNGDGWNRVTNDQGIIIELECAECGGTGWE